MRHISLLLILYVLLIASCGSDTDLEDIILCDGSNDIRLAYHTKSSGTMPNHRVLVENGYTFLYLDGQCRYWVFPRENDGPSTSMWSDVVSGKLTEDQEAQLKRDLAVIQWQRWHQTTFHASGVFDAGTATFWTPTAAFQCTGECGSKLRNSIQTNIGTWIRTLAEQGDPVYGAMRVAAVIMPDSILRQNRPHPVQAAPAGLSLSLKEHAVSEAEATFLCNGDGFLVTGDAAETLRRYRREYYNREYGDFWYVYLPIKDEDGTMYMVYARDTIPLEDDRGLVQLEGVPRSFCSPL